MWQHNARNNEELLAAIMLRWRRVQSSRCFTAAMYYWKLYQCSAVVSANQPSREPTLSRTNYFPLFPLHFSYCLTSTALFFGLSERVAFTVFANEVYCFRRLGFSLAVWPHVADAKWNVLLSVLLHKRNNGGGWWMLHWNMKSITDVFLCNRLHNSLNNYQTTSVSSSGLVFTKKSIVLNSKKQRESSPFK